jgi:ribonuclease HII
MKRRLDLRYERTYWAKGLTYIAGVDEAGRGPLAGPVVAAAVVFQPTSKIEGVNDSKKLSPEQREALYERICRHAVSVGVGVVSHETIDNINIHQATMLAMKQAVEQLSPLPQHLLIDGPHYTNNDFPFTTIIDGDAQCFSIAAASIIAKVTRDRLMMEYDKQFPQYGFGQHKGYATKRHIEAIRQYGYCEIHRKSFRLHNQQMKLFANE